MNRDFTETQIFISACLDERQKEAFRHMRSRLNPDFCRWADEQYSRLEKLPQSSIVLGDTLNAAHLPPGMLCEFGVCTGNSTNLIAQKVNPREVYGFDSFEGLPDDWVIGNICVPKGFLAVDSGRLQFEPNVRLVKGFFNESLPRFMQEKSEPIAFLHIDCDTYQSTVDILKYTSPRFQVGTIIVFDEILGDMGAENEMKALWEYLQTSQIEFEWIGHGGHCWTAESQARFKSIKRNDFLFNLRFALMNLGGVIGFLGNKKKVETAPSAAALRITRLPNQSR